MAGPRILIAADNGYARSELSILINRADRGAVVTRVAFDINALKTLKNHRTDAVFLDITSSRSGLEFARALSSIPNIPAMIFVSSHSMYALDGFDLNILDYLVKPVSASRVNKTMRRLAGSQPNTVDDQPLAVTRGSITEFIRRSDVLWVEADGDRVVLHTRREHHLLRTSLAARADSWRASGFMRIHRSYLVNISKIEKVLTRHRRVTVVVGDGSELDVSRRHARDLPEYMAPLGVA